MGEIKGAKVSARKKRVVIVAMKPQIRGRIRRNVMTFLDMGAEVIIVNSRPRDDFLVGLEHPDLHLQFLNPKSLSVRYTNWVTEQNRKRRARWYATKAAQAQRSLQPTSFEFRRRSASPILRPIVRLTSSRRAVRLGRLLLRTWRRTHRWFIRRGRALRKQRDEQIRIFLRRFHRVNRFLEFWRLSAQHVRSLAPDLVVSSDLPGLVGANIAAQRLGRPHLHDCHELYLESTSFKGWEKRLLRPVEAWFMRRADSVVVVNQTIRDVYRNRYGTEGVVLRNCGPAIPQEVLDSPVDLRQLLGVPPAAPIVLYQGGLVAGRGLDVLIAAAAEFPEGAHTVLVGSGRLREELGRQVQQLGLVDRVHFIPAVQPHELPAFTAAASVGVIPYQPVSDNNRMALPNKVFEYTGAGIPFAAADLPELRRIAEEVGCAAVYGPFDPHGLAAAVATILAPSHYETYRRAAVDFGRRNTWEREKLILISEAERIAPALTTPTTSSSTLGAVEGRTGIEQPPGTNSPARLFGDMRLQKFGAWCRQLFLGPTGPTGELQRKVPPAGTAEPNFTEAGEKVRSSGESDTVVSMGSERGLPPDEERAQLRDRNEAEQSQLEKPLERNQSRQSQVIAPSELGPERDRNEMLLPAFMTRSHTLLAQDGDGGVVTPADLEDDPQSHLQALRGQDKKLQAQIATLRDREAALNRQLATMKERLAASSDQIVKLRTSVQEQRSRVALANERTTHVKELMKERLAASTDQIVKLRTSVQEQRSRVVQANERTTQVKALLKERSLLYQDKLATSREKLLLKSSLYDAARRYIGIYRQGFLFDEVAKSGVDFGADAYLCLLPSTVPAGLLLSRLNGGRVYCDCVENVEVHKHSLAPRIHPPTLELINLAAFGSLMAVDGILTVGNALAKTLTRFGPPVHVVPNFRRFEQPIPANELREACGLEPEDRLLFASGNVVVGFEAVVHAMAALPSNVHLAAFVKLKPADYEATVMKEIAQLGLSDRIHFFDFVEYSRLASLAADADVGLITSDVSNPNGAVALPNRLFDYLTAGLPVIAPPMPDVVDIVREYGFGKTLEQVTAGSWANAITEVLRDRHVFKEAAREARRVLTWENGEDDLIASLGNPRSVTLIGFRDISRYQRFLRVAQTLTARGIRVKALFLSDDPAPVQIPGAEFYHFSNRYGLGDGPIRVSHER